MDEQRTKIIGCQSVLDNTLTSFARTALFTTTTTTSTTKFHLELNEYFILKIFYK